MKNVSKLLLLSILAGAGYLFGMVVYGADCPSVFWSYICSPTNTCNNPGSTCLCNGVSINDWQICSDSVDPTADWNPGTVTNWNICGDADGCNCWSTLIANWDTCSIVSSDTTAPILVWWSVSVLNKTATFPFTCDEWLVTISCLWSCGSCSVTANTWNNTVSFTLANWTYSDCSLIGQDWAGNVSNSLSIPSFTINYSAGGWGGWGWGWTPICSDSSLVCTNNIYVLKSGYYCVWWNLWKTCWTSSNTTTLLSILDDVDLTETGFINLLDVIKTEKSVVYEYTPQWITIRIYVPKYKQWLIRKTILSLNNSLYTAINKKLLKVTDPSYMIENYENISVDNKILVYKEIGALTRTYNEFLGVLYMVLDMKQKEYLPLAKYYLENFFNDFINFKK